MSLQTEVLIMWTALTFYALATVVFVVGMVFRSQRTTAVAMWLGVAGLAIQAVAIIGRWIRLGHGPYLGFYEAMSGSAFIVLALFLLGAWRFPSLKPIGFVLMPTALLIIAAGMLADKTGSGVTPTLASWWLTIHVMFAKLSYIAFIIAFAFGAVFLVRERVHGGRWKDILDKLPSQEMLDDLTFKFVAVGFIFLAIMIVAGAIWANEAWGSYWSWDPIETWSLISWLVYAVVVHLRLTMGWRGRRFAWATIVALPVVLFALIGVPIVFNSIHGAYLKGTA